MRYGDEIIWWKNKKKKKKPEIIHINSNFMHHDDSLQVISFNVWQSWKIFLNNLFSTWDLDLNGGQNRIFPSSLTSKHKFLSFDFLRRQDFARKKNIQVLLIKLYNFP